MEEADAVTSSVSKGVFVFKPSSKKKKRSFEAEDYFPRLHKESASCTTLRGDVYNGLRTNMEDDIGDLSSEISKKLLDDLTKFLQNCHTNTNGKDRSTARGCRTELPTAVLITGVSSPDHSSIFRALVDIFKKRVSPHVIRLTANQSSSLKTLMSAVVGQFIGQEDAMSEDEEEETEEPSSSYVNVRKIPGTMQVLRSWYQANIQTVAPAKKKKISTPSPSQASHSLVILFEDVGSFVPRVLQDFVHITSQYLPSLPFSFVFGFPTSVAAVHQVIPRSVSSLLRIEKFQTQPALVSLSQIIEMLLLTPNYPFKLGPKVYHLLSDLFLYHSFSVRAFVKGIQVSLMEHFYCQPLSFLCCSSEESPSYVTSLTHTQLELCRSLKSFRRYVESLPPQEQRALLLDDKHAKGVLNDLLEIVYEYHKNFFPVLKCLHHLTSRLPHAPLGRKLRELYGMTLETHIVEQEGYNQAVGLWRLYAREELMSHLEACIETLSEEEGQLEEICKKLTLYRQQLEALANTGHLPAPKDTSETEEDNTNDQSHCQPRTGKVTLHSLQEQLLVEAKKKKELTQYEVLRHEVVAFLHHVFEKILVAPQSLTLHEIFYFDDVSKIRQYLQAAPRVAVQTALTNPYVYLQNDACKVDPGTVTDALPDICIVYKLHLEYGRLINLYDWLQAFVTVVTGGEEEKKKTKGKKAAAKDEKEVDPQLHARFIRAVSELQFLGFIKPTKQKTDHVQRLTWGGC